MAYKLRTPYQDNTGNSGLANTKIFSNEMVIPGSVYSINNQSILTDNLQIYSLVNSQNIRGASNQSGGNQETEGNKTVQFNKSSTKMSQRNVPQVKIDQNF